MQNGRKIDQMSIKYTNIPFARRSKIRIFGSKRNHLANLLARVVRKLQIVSLGKKVTGYCNISSGRR
jgi:hypothetical protein